MIRSSAAARYSFAVVCTTIAIATRFVTRVRDRERTRKLTRLPAIAVTAYGAASDREQALRAGFDAHLGKPVDPDALVRTVSRIAPTARA